MYKFRCDIRGHSSDVRCLSHMTEDVIISGSRDKTCRVWTSNSGTFEQGYSFHGHTDFISSVCYLPPSEMYPDGLIVTGSNDHSICGYSTRLSEPLFKLTSHSDTVCCVYPAVIGNCGLLSSSWDSTVVMWDLVSRQTAFKVPGHGKPVWCVIQMACGTIITGSADKALRSYSKRGEYLRAYYGHLDCVRALYPISDTHFLSCGNDGHVLRWNINDGNCDLAIDSVHHYLYCVSFIKNKNITVYCGERSCIYVNSSSGSEVIPVPCTSVWCSMILPNDDIAVACSDGVIRIYTCNSKRYADEFKLQIYESEIQKFAAVEYQDKKKDIRCPYLNDLCGPEVLHSSGKISNEICFIRQGFLAVMYSWSTDRWLELAKRKGTYQYDISKKKMHFGKVYDYLFPINLDDNQPNLIFPLTLGEDILDRVIQFMSEFSLPSNYSETIYNHVANSVKDDFIKASLLEASLQCFQSSSDDSLESVNKYFPKSTFLFFEKGKTDQIVGKLAELSKSLLIPDANISEKNVDTLEKLTKMNYKCSSEECGVLLNLLDWPEDSKFPVFDLLRLAVRNDSFHHHVFTNIDTSNRIVSSLIFHLQNDKFPVNQLMCLKVYCNMFAYEPGRKIISDEFKNIITALKNIQFPSTFSSSLEVAASSLILNLIIMTEKGPSMRTECLKCITELTKKLQDKEALVRTFVGIGNLISYEGSFFIPKILKDKLIALSEDSSLQGSQAYQCLSTLLTCFQEN